MSPLPYYELTLGAIVLTVLIVVRLNRSRVGRAWAAIREDEDAAEAMGVPAFRMKLWAFAVGAAIGGLGGWLDAARVSFINPDNFLFLLSLIILSAVVMGGTGSIAGVIAGGIAIAFIAEYLREAAAGETLTRWLNTLIGGNAGDISQYRVLLFGVALVAVVVFRPQGLLPSRRRAAESVSRPSSRTRICRRSPPSTRRRSTSSGPTGPTSWRPGGSSAATPPPSFSTTSRSERRISAAR